MLNLDEVGKMLGVSRYTARAWAEEGRIRYSLIDGEMCFTQEDVDDFTRRTNIKYIPPEGPEAALERMKKYYKDNDLMDPNEIENLINALKNEE